MLRKRIVKIVYIYGKDQACQLWLMHSPLECIWCQSQTMPPKKRGSVCCHLVSRCSGGLYPTLCPCLGLFLLPSSISTLLLFPLVCMPKLGTNKSRVVLSLVNKKPKNNLGFLQSLLFSLYYSYYLNIGYQKETFKERDKSKTKIRVLLLIYHCSSAHVTNHGYLYNNI